MQISTTKGSTIIKLKFPTCNKSSTGTSRTRIIFKEVEEHEWDGKRRKERPCGPGTGVE